MKITARRYHDIDCGHRIVGHEGKCSLLHGHTYRIHFTLEAPQLDAVGRVVDFSVIKEKLCNWLEYHYDHRFLAWSDDEELRHMPWHELLLKSIVWVPFNPTSENIAAYLLEVVGPAELRHTGATLVEVTVEETRKCCATARL